MNHIVIDPRADADLDEQVDYLARTSRRIALRLYKAARLSFQFLADSPDLGSPCQIKNRRLADVRVWPVRGFPNHLIYYRPIEDGVQILRILHATRDAGSEFGER